MLEDLLFKKASPSSERIKFYNSRTVESISDCILQEIADSMAATGFSQDILLQPREILISRAVERDLEFKEALTKVAQKVLCFSLTRPLLKLRQKLVGKS